MVYLDHAATTPMRPEVIDVLTEVSKAIFGNPSSVHGYGRKAHERLENARGTIAKSIHVKADEIIFNSGGTESDNTAILSTALSHQDKGKHVITTQIEHPAVLNTMRYLETLGFEVTYLPVDEKGQLAVETVKAALRPDTILVSIMFANNETGNLLPIPEIGALLQEHPAVFHTDAVQAYGKVPLFPHEWGIDLLSVSGHKINGPKGIGFLYKNQSLSLPTFLHGGEQEEKRRAGTENLAAICAMAKAIECLPETIQTENQKKYGQFSDLVQSCLKKAGITFRVNGDPDHKLTHILNLQFPGLSNELLLVHLDLKGYAISTGSACTAGNVEPSHVLEAMYGTESSVMEESIRVSFGYGNTKEEVESFCDTLIETIERLK